MKPNQMTLRAARARLSKIIGEGAVVAIGRPYENIRAFIVPVPEHEYSIERAEKKALRQARANLLAACKAQTKNE